MAEKNLKEVLCEIRDTYGMDILTNGKRLIAVFRDLSQVKKDQRMLRYFVEAGGHTALLGAGNLSPAMQQARLQQTIRKLCTEMLVSDEAAQTVCNAFWTAAYGKPAIQQKSQIRCVAEKKVSAPVQHCGAPVKVTVEIDPDLEILGNTVVSYKGTREYVQIPEGITCIGESAFEKNQTIRRLKLPESLQHIGVRAFISTGIREIIFPKSLQTIAREAFSQTSLQCIVLPPEIKQIDSWAFSECKQLKKLEFTHMPNKLHSFAFSGCKQLEEVIIPEGTERVDLDIFDKPENLARIYIPDSVMHLNYFFSANSTSRIEVIASEKWIADNRNFFQSNPNYIPVPSKTGQKSKGNSKNNKAKELYNLALHYYNKTTHPDSGSLALQYCTQAAQMEYADAQNMLGTIYDRGFVRENQVLVEKNEETAIRYYLAAAASGHSGAQLNAARCYNNQKNYSEAVYWARKAASLGNPEAESSLAFHLKCLHTDESLAEALEIYLKHAQMDSFHYHDKVAEFYENGWGTPRNLLQAARWKQCFWWDGTPEGDAKALCSVGKDYYQFAHGDQDRLSLAFAYFMESAKLGSAEGQFMLGVFYKNGYGVAADLQEAAKWYRNAAEKNHETACEVLSEMYAKGLGVPWNPIEARKWKKKAGY